MTEKELMNAAKAAYHKKWRERNPEKWLEIRNRYWLKKASEIRSQEMEIQEKEPFEF